MSAREKASSVWRRVRIAWVILGMGATLIFVTWSVIAHPTRADACGSKSVEMIMTDARRPYDH